MGFGRHKDLRGFESASFGTLWSTSLCIICSILQPYALLTISLYVHVLISIHTQVVVCILLVQISTQQPTSLNSLSSALTFFLAQLWTLLLCPDLQNLRQPSIERCNLQVKANASHNFSVKLGIRMEMSGPKLCEALASTCRLRCSLDGCLKFWRSGWSRRVQSRAEKKLKADKSELREVGC